MPSRPASHYLIAATLVFFVVLSVPARAADEAALRKRLNSLLNHSALEGAAIGCVVRDLEGHTVFQRHGGAALIPASNVKALVSATAVDLLGAGYVFGAQLWTETPPEQGALAGSLYLTGCTNPNASESAIWPLAQQLQAKGVKSVAGDIVATGPLTAADRDYGLKSAQRLRSALGELGIKVQGEAREGFCPGAPVKIASHDQIALEDYLRRTNKSSENHLAQVLLNSLLAVYADPTSPDPAFLLYYWALQGISPEGQRLVDGSGYSRENRLTADFLAAVLLRMTVTPAGYTTLSRSFPTAGVDGTLADRMRGTAAEGRVRAKTGTLRRVSCLSGYVESGGHPRLVFSLLLNDFNCSQGTARNLEDRVAVALAEWVD